MAISDLLPRKAAGSETRNRALHCRLEYDQNEEKTDGAKLVSSYMCNPETAADEFETSKLIYEMSTGRRQTKERDIIAYRIIQSFKPGEITPKEANKLGYELAMKFTKGKHQFVVSTHIDKKHIHNHVEFNSTNLDCNGKFKNFKNSSFALRELNDKICREHGYSVIENPKEKGQRYQEKAAAKRGRSHKERLRQTIDRVLPGCKDFEEFLSNMRMNGYEIKYRGTSLEFRDSEQERFTRSYRLGNEYTKEALQKRIEEPVYKSEKIKQTSSLKNQTKEKYFGSSEAKKKKQPVRKNISLLVDIEAKIKEGKGKGYERWAKVFNLKEAAKTLNFLTEKGISDYEGLVAKADDAAERFDSISAHMKSLEAKLTETAQMKKHIINYVKTREAYKEYKKSKDKNLFREKHEEEIKKHEAAKAAFNELDGKPIPKVAKLNEQYTALLAEKKASYEEYKTVKKEMIEYKTALQNVDKILGLDDSGQDRERKNKQLLY